jgi:hypothetical protein
LTPIRSANGSEDDGDNGTNWVSLLAGAAIVLFRFKLFVKIGFVRYLKHQPNQVLV